MLNLRLELVVDGRNKYNHDLGDSFACTVPFLVHELVLSNLSSAVSMTILADSEDETSLSRVSQTLSSCP